MLIRPFKFSAARSYSGASFLQYPHLQHIAQELRQLASSARKLLSFSNRLDSPRGNKSSYSELLGSMHGLLESLARELLDLLRVEDGSRRHVGQGEGAEEQGSSDLPVNGYL